MEISQSDADALKFSGGRRVKLTSEYGEAVVPVRVRADLKPGVLFVPYAFRDQVSNVLGSEGLAPVKVERA